MNILLTGATGYIGKRLLPVLLEEGHTVWCCVRDPKRFSYEGPGKDRIQLLQIDFLESSQFKGELPPSFDVAYYLMHSMSSNVNKFESLEEQVARSFLRAVDAIELRQVVYLSGMVNSQKLSRHLQSRLRVEELLEESPIPLTVLRAGIIVGSGSASFEIIRDLVEKLPVMVAPRWLNTRTQPIGIRDVLHLLNAVKGKTEFYHQHFDIGGPEVLTHREMLLKYARVRKLKRWIFTLPIMTPRLSSYWLYFVTSTSYPLAVNLVNSMKIDVVCRDQRLQEQLGQSPLTYEQSVRLAFQRIKQNEVVSSWKDAAVSSKRDMLISRHIEVPEYGCFRDIQEVSFPKSRREQVIENLWSIGGRRGWYYGSWLWKIRGLMDKMAGGVGLRRGRTSPTRIEAGDALDFWRVLDADRERGRLLLYAEMKMPGQAWLEFDIRAPDKDSDSLVMHQEATFRPSGILGRLYWYAVLPFHFFVFRGMLRRLVFFEGRG